MPDPTISTILAGVPTCDMVPHQGALLGGGGRETMQPCGDHDDC